MKIILLMLVPLVICLLFLWLTCRLLLNSRWIRGWLQGTAGLLFLALTVFGSLLAWDMKSFADVSQMKPLAIVSFTRLENQNWNVDITERGGVSQVFKLDGDLWTYELEHFLAGEDQYQLSFARGKSVHRRYLALEQERSVSHGQSDYELHASVKNIDSWSLLKLTDPLLYVEAKTLRGDFVPLRDGAIYEIWLANDRVDIRPVNTPAKNSMASVQ